MAGGLSCLPERVVSSTWSRRRPIRLMSRRWILSTSRAPPWSSRACTETRVARAPTPFCQLASCTVTSSPTRSGRPSPRCSPPPSRLGGQPTTPTRRSTASSRSSALGPLGATSPSGTGRGAPSTTRSAGTAATARSTASSARSGSSSTPPARSTTRRGRSTAPRSAPPESPRGREKKDPNTTPECQALGRSRGGLSTELRTVCDGNGLPLAVHLTASQRSESAQFEAVCDLVEAPRRPKRLGRRGVVVGVRRCFRRSSTRGGTRSSG